jgi:hypothetical protein
MGVEKIDSHIYITKHIGFFTNPIFYFLTFSFFLFIIYIINKRRMKLLSKKLSLSEMQSLCQSFRKEIIDMVFNAKSGHIAGPLSAVEHYVALYFGDVLKYNPKSPE